MRALLRIARCASSAAWRSISVSFSGLCLRANHWTSSRSRRSYASRPSSWLWRGAVPASPSLSACSRSRGSAPCPGTAPVIGRTMPFAATPAVDASAFGMPRALVSHGVLPRVCSTGGAASSSRSTAAVEPKQLRRPQHERRAGSVWWLSTIARRKPWAAGWAGSRLPVTRRPRPAQIRGELSATEALRTTS